MTPEEAAAANPFPESDKNAAGCYALAIETMRKEIEMGNRHRTQAGHRAERERCAAIADRIAEEHAGDGDEWDEACEHTARKIAAEIRRDKWMT